MLGRINERVIAALSRNHFPYFDYPGDPRPRYGYGRPAHPQLDAIIRSNAAAYAQQLTQFLTLRECLEKIPLHAQAPESVEPCWMNGWLPGLDAAALYGMVASHRPSRYVEIGSGNSTKFVRRAIKEHDLSTTITSLDPMPRAEIDMICDRVLRKGVETVDLAIFDELQAGDMLFVDNSHRVFMNSDAAVIFLEVLPRLKPGVMVHFHDIMLPLDYPPEWSHRYYSEQYVLAAYLLSGHPNFEILLPNFFVHNEPKLRKILLPLWQSVGVPESATGGGSFWIRTREPIGYSGVQ